MSRRDDIGTLLQQHERDWLKNQCACGVPDEKQDHREHLIDVIERLIVDEFDSLQSRFAAGMRRYVETGEGP